MLTNVHVEIN